MWIWLWADGQPQGDDNGVFIYSQEDGRLDFADRPLRSAHADLTRRVLHFAVQGERHTALLREFRRVAFGV